MRLHIWSACALILAAGCLGASPDDPAEGPATSPAATSPATSRPPASSGSPSPSAAAAWSADHLPTTGLPAGVRFMAASDPWWERETEELGLVANPGPVRADALADLGVDAQPMEGRGAAYYLPDPEGAGEVLVVGVWRFGTAAQANDAAEGLCDALSNSFYVYVAGTVTGLVRPIAPDSGTPLHTLLQGILGRTGAEEACWAAFGSESWPEEEGTPTSHDPALAAFTPEDNLPAGFGLMGEEHEDWPLLAAVFAMESNPGDGDPDSDGPEEVAFRGAFYVDATDAGQPYFMALVSKYATAADADASYACDEDAGSAPARVLRDGLVVAVYVSEYDSLAGGLDAVADAVVAATGADDVTEAALAGC